MSAATSSTSTTISHLITLLTNPLNTLYPQAILTALQLSLQTNFSSFLPPTLSPFTIYLSPFSLPPAPFYSACLTSGVSWPQWIHVLGGGKAVYIFVMEGNIKLRYGEQGEGVTVWSKDDADIVPVSRSSKLRGLLSAVQARSQARIASEADAETDDSESDAESDSDSESTTSSALSAFSTSSASTSTSIASLPSLSSSKVHHVPCVPYSANPTCSTPLSKSTSTTPPSPPQTVSRTQHRLTRTLPNANINTTKSNPTRYKYQGGETGVVTGGVMLGAAPAANAAGTPNTYKGVRRAAQGQGNVKPQSMTGKTGKASASASKADSIDNWRRPRASVGAVKITL